MNFVHFGEIAAIVTAICWTITAVSFEAAGKKIGSLSVNFIRLIIAFGIISFYNLFSRGLIFPTDASAKSWLFLFISGLIGFVIGDMFLFEAYVEIGSRISLLIMAASPPITAIAGYFILGERITLFQMAGMFVTIAGIAMVILVKGDSSTKVKFSHPVRGLVFAFLGALGQAFGLIFSKLGMGNYNPFAATQIRIIAGMIGFAVVITLKGHWPSLIKSIKDMKAMGYTTVGAFFGPFLGVSFSLLAVQYTSTGIVSTITSISPILIIPLSIFIFKEKVITKEVIGAFITIAGVVMLFM